MDNLDYARWLCPRILVSLFELMVYLDYSYINYIFYLTMVLRLSKRLCGNYENNCLFNNSLYCYIS